MAGDQGPSAPAAGCNSTIVTVTDRTQLDDQIANTFQRCGFPAPERIDRSRPEPEHLRQRRRARNPDQPDPLDLQTALQRGGGRTFITTIQKFEEALDTPGGSLDVLNASDNVIIMVDEAHRTQYGLLGARMAQALPNAVLVGFTGTPIDKGFGRSTMGHFGSLIDAYTIPQSVADGATVRIMYEARLPDLSIQSPRSLDELFDAIFHEEAEENRARIRRRYANQETIAEAEQRIVMISLDIARHFGEKVRPNGFKAQVVAPSRAAALRYSRNLNNFGVRAYPIITTSASDGPEFQEARGLNQDQVTNAFVDPTGEPEVLVVVDMLAHGFRRAGGAGALPGPSTAGARPAPGGGPGEPALLPRTRGGAHREELRPGGRLSRGGPGPPPGPGGLRLAGRPGHHDPHRG